MWKRTLVVVVVVVLHVGLPSTRADTCGGEDLPKPCKCEDNKVECECTDDAQLQSIPTDFPRTITSMKFKGCNLGNITAEINYPDLTYLDLSGGRIADIVDDAFKKLTKLVHLGLEHNMLSGAAIKKEVFSSLAAVTELDLSSNVIANLPNEKCVSGENMPALKMLKLTENKLENLNAKPFDQLASLATLDLSRNKLVDVDFGAAGETFSGLKTLDLSENKLTALGKKHLSGMASLETLKVQGNQIETVAADAFEDAAAIKDVYLTNNKLTPTLSAAFQNLNALTKLDVSDNQLYWMDANAISWGVLTETFNVAKNRWECNCRNAWLIEQNVVKDSIPEADRPDFQCYLPADATGKAILDNPDVAVFFSRDCPCSPSTPPPSTPPPSTPTNITEGPSVTTVTAPPDKSSSSSAHDTGVGFAIGLMVGLLLAVVAVVVWCRCIRARGPRASYTHHMNA